jgi:4-aminobutyrate aminotransferase-like enzyme/Ser/Thr protein kinase RdoA (MazF antagonist)
MPNEAPTFLDAAPPQLDLDEVLEWAQTHFGFRREPQRLSGERDLNLRFNTDDGQALFKVANRLESSGMQDFQHQALRHLAQVDPELPVPRVLGSLSGSDRVQVEARDGYTYTLRALSYLPGELLASVAATPNLMMALGSLLGQLDKGLAGFFHPAARQPIVWNLLEAGKLRNETDAIADEEGRRLVEHVLDRMIAAVLPSLASLGHQVLHADAHANNLVVSSGDEPRLTGILDFGDLNWGPRPAEIAIAADYPGLPVDQYIELLAAITSGYDSIYPLSEAEIEVIPDLVVARWATGSTIISWRQKYRHETHPHVNISLDQLNSGMAGLLNFGLDATVRELRLACGWPTAARWTRATSASLQERRKSVLGSHLSLFYDSPLHVERGQGAWLFGTDGKRYLDGYNNVPVCGHSHPHVVRAISRQAASLNTNTRYIYENVVRYAERLSERLDPALDVCMFVNSGSEANDVAWRMAKHWSGQQGGLVMQNAYHGITDAISAFSPEAFSTSLPPSMVTLRVPDLYRETETAQLDLGRTDFNKQLAKLAAAGFAPAAMMIDTLLVSNGTPSVPEGYIALLVGLLREAGGLYIADEVQAGFGRSGVHFWGYELHGVTPDIVTMGKPIGSGFPMGVVATRREILESFVGETGLFSTFGGNPVACAAGMAVLDVIDREGLQENARQTGEYLRAGLSELMIRYSAIGDVRGTGLLTGLELVEDAVAKTPAPDLTKQLTNWMRDHQVLIGKGGEHGNVLKIRPPLVFGRAEADRMIEVLDAGLSALT